MISNHRRSIVISWASPLCINVILLLTVGFLGVLAGPALGTIDVWIDPGHGGTDSGALGFNGVAPYEKELNLDVSQYLENFLISFGYDATYRTRHGDTFLSPQRRWKISNGVMPNDEAFQAPCRLFVSVHMNWYGDPLKKGTLTCYASSKREGKTVHAGAEDGVAADSIQRNLMTWANVAFLGCSQDRRLMLRNKLAVLTRSQAPAVLVECCFLSNACQYNHITSPGNQADVAYGIACGVSHYLPLALASSVVRSPAVHQPKTVKATELGAPIDVTLSTLEEGFEGTTFPPAGWSIETAGLGPPYVWQRTTDSAYVESGSGAALVGGESPSAIDEWLISPGVYLGGTDHAIKFSWSGSQIWSSVMNASLSIRQEGMSVWTQLWSIATDEPPADPFIYRERVVDLSAWVAKTVQFGFRIAGTNGADFALDDIVVGDFTPTGTAPNDVCVNAAGLGSVFSIKAVTCYAANDLNPFIMSGSCVTDELDGPDVFYEIGAGPGDSLHASVTAQWGAALYLLDGCASPVCLAGGYAEDDRTAPILDYKFSTLGSYYLVVDGEDGSCGPFELDGQIIHTATGVIDEGSVPPINLVIHPNPAGGPIFLSAALAASRSGAPILEIYDVAGKRVLRIVGAAIGRQFSYVWDRRDVDGMPVASGVYFARLQVGQQAVVRKLVILR